MWNHRIARVLVLGEIDRVTEFEKGMPGAEAEVNGEWVKDPFPDDRGVALKVKNKGLVVVGGCSHAGIINTVKHAQRVTGTPKVHAILGGFHLTLPTFTFESGERAERRIFAHGEESLVKEGGFSRELNQSINGFIADGEGVGSNFRKSFMARVDLCMRRGKRFGERGYLLRKACSLLGRESDGFRGHKAPLNNALAPR